MIGALREGDGAARPRAHRGGRDGGMVIVLAAGHVATC
jgi:hypothetical protein